MCSFIDGKQKATAVGEDASKKSEDIQVGTGHLHYPGNTTCANINTTGSFISVDADALLTLYLYVFYFFFYDSNYNSLMTQNISADSRQMSNCSVNLHLLNQLKVHI